MDQSTLPQLPFTAQLRRFEITDTHVDNSDAFVSALVGLAAAIAIVTFVESYCRSKLVSVLTFIFLLSAGATQSLATTAGVVTYSVAMMLITPALMRWQLRVSLHVVSFILVSQCSSFAYGSVLLLVRWRREW